MKTPTNTNKALGERLRNEPPKPLIEGHTYDVFVHGGPQMNRIHSRWAVAPSVVRETIERYKNGPDAARVLYRDISERLCKGIHPGD